MPEQLHSAPPPASAAAADPLRPPLPADAPLLRWENLLGSSRGLALVQAAERHNEPLLVVTRDPRGIQELEDELRFYAGAGGPPILAFPDWECLPYDAFSPHQDIISQRLLTLHVLPTLARGIVLTSATTLLHRLPPRAYLLAHSLRLAVGDRLELTEFRRQLEQAAYQAVGQVMQAGEFAVRGGLVDLYPMGSDTPYRIDLFDEDIDSIRSFDVDSQRSIYKVSEVRLLPAREFPMDETAQARFRQNFRIKFEGDPSKSRIYKDVSKGVPSTGIEYYLPLFFDATARFSDYLPAGTVI